MGTAGIYQLIKELVGESSFHQTKIPFLAVATDLEKGEEVILRQGQMAEAIMASCTLPGFFPPFELQERLLVDGGIVSSVPVEVTRCRGADIVIAVNLDKEVIRREFRHGLDILFQADDIRAHELNRIKLSSADIVIEPEVHAISWTQFSRAGDCIDKGEKAARAALPEIKLLMSRVRKRLLIKQFFPFFDRKG
jgi:NTE family protein